jgi:hypothetical protein
MIEIDIILGSKYESPWREEMICTSCAQVLILAKNVLANHGIVHGINAWSVHLELDEDGENI